VLRSDTHKVRAAARTYEGPIGSHRRDLQPRVALKSRDQLTMPRVSSRSSRLAARAHAAHDYQREHFKYIDLDNEPLWLIVFNSC
jgi:hypothetical protein